MPSAKLQPEADQGGGEFTPLPYSIPDPDSRTRIDRLIDTAGSLNKMADKIAAEIKQDPDWRKKVLWRQPKKHS
jgi:hypothetical protein